MSVRTFLPAYLERIGYTGSLQPTAANLRALHRAHLFAVPFENLDIHVPMQLSLSKEALFDKIVGRGRGGFCFEQNGLLGAVLTELGFETDLLEANVFTAERNSFGIRKNHLALCVHCAGERFLADVGFGASFLDPLHLDETALQSDEAGTYRLELGEDGGGRFYCQELRAPQSHLSYRFFLEPRALEDFEDACLYMQTSSETHFTQKRICSQWTKAGRVTLSDDKLIETDWAGQRHEVPVGSEEEFHRLLEERFAITLRTQRPPGQPPRPGA